MGWTDSTQWLLGSGAGVKEKDNPLDLFNSQLDGDVIDLSVLLRQFLGVEK